MKSKFKKNGYFYYNNNNNNDLNMKNIILTKFKGDKDSPGL
jgi:hypothetical protein